MCIFCDEGATLDEARFLIHGAIDRFGWFIQYVEARPVRRCWAYTIGLTTGFQHPELVVTGVTPEVAGLILNELGNKVRDRYSFSSGNEVLDISGRQIRFSDVHPAHFDRGVLAVWDDYYECLGSTLPERGALEVLLPGQKAKLASRYSEIG